MRFRARRSRLSARKARRGGVGLAVDGGGAELDLQHRPQAADDLVPGGMGDDAELQQGHGGRFRRSRAMEGGDGGFG